MPGVEEWKLHTLFCKDKMRDVITPNSMLVRGEELIYYLATDTWGRGTGLEDL